VQETWNCPIMAAIWPLSSEGALAQSSQEAYWPLDGSLLTFVWTLNAVSDAYGPADNVRNYLDRRTIRTILAELPRTRSLRYACEVGCGYGCLIIMMCCSLKMTAAIERRPMANVEDGSQFLSRARSVESYQEMMHPFKSVLVRDRVVEPTYFNSTPGKCMLFNSPEPGGGLA